MSDPTAEIDKAIRYAWEDVQAARMARRLRPHAVTQADVQPYEDALDSLLDSRLGYSSVSPQ